MESRLEELEIRYSHQQDTLLQLSDVVARHEKEIERLRKLVEDMRAPRDNAQLPLDPDERPPHY